MNRFWIVLCIGLMLFGCKSKKTATSKKNKHKPKTEQVVTKTEKPTTTEIEIGKPTKSETRLTTQQYIDLYSSIAKTEMQLYNIPASITMAQGILESGSGNGRLAREANNHFGIKCHDWTGERIYHDDDEAQECFRKYIDAKYSYRDHSLFLTQRRRYSGLFKLRKGDYKAWAKGLKAAGYATDKKYPHKLISLIDRYHLHKLDKEVLGRTYRNPDKELYETPTTRITTKQEPESIDFANVETHIVQSGETMYSISRQYGVSVSNLQNLNGLSTTYIDVGQELLVKNTEDTEDTEETPLTSAEKTEKRIHIVKKGETLYSISKQYNITVQAIKALNTLTNNTLSIGQELHIK
ncbi:MAG: glucosaminidase domain-containing protein [Aestuariibaculum sp.]